MIDTTTAMDHTCFVPRIAPTGFSFQGRGASAGSLGGNRLRGLREYAKRDATAFAFERDSRPGGATV